MEINIMSTNLFNSSLTERFSTLKRNIKSKSNSFYDSYLDLLEATIKYFLDENNIRYDQSKTCGYILKEDAVNIFLLTSLKLDDYTISKMPDYIKKCNDHKHKKEKRLQIESVINFLKVYFDLVNFYLDYIKGIRVEFDGQYFASIFGETERLNVEYRNQVIKLQEDLKEAYDNNRLSEQDLNQYKALLSIKEIEVLTLDDQNQKLQDQISILKDIKLNSLEVKLNKALEMLVNLNGEILENRVATDAVYRSITGQDIKSAIEKNKSKI